MEKRINRMLSSDEEVDHIDGDGYNDTPSNIQILTHEENKLKMYLYGENEASYGRQTRDLVCPVCGKVFTRNATFINVCLQSSINPDKKVVCCSASCGGRFNILTAKYKTLDEQTVDVYNAYTGLEDLFDKVGPERTVYVARCVSKTIPVYDCMFNLYNKSLQWKYAIYELYKDQLLTPVIKTCGEGKETIKHMIALLNEVKNTLPVTNVLENPYCAIMNIMQFYEGDYICKGNGITPFYKSNPEEFEISKDDDTKKEYIFDKNNAANPFDVDY